MSIHATARADFSTWDEKNYDESEGLPTLARTKVGNVYHGDLEAEGSSRGLMVYLPDGSADFIGLERITGRLGGRSGSFVVRTGGAYRDGLVTYDWSILPGSGTGELAGVRGGGRMVWANEESGSLTFDYEFDQ